MVCPVVLTQFVPAVGLEEDNVDDEEGHCFKDIIRIGKNLFLFTVVVRCLHRAQ